MLPYRIFFTGTIAFLVGILAASAGVPPFFVTVGTLAVSLGFLVAKRRTHAVQYGWYAGLILLVIAGSLYYRIDDRRLKAAYVPYGEKIAFEGRIANDPVMKGEYQEAVVELTNPVSARVLLRVARYPELRYCDLLELTGKVERPSSESYMRFLEKEGMRGTMQFPKTVKTRKGSCSSVRGALIAVKHRIMEAYASVLPPEEADFLAGLTIGARGSFSESLKTAMQASGTTHLVALSGYNITILVAVLLGMLLRIVPRRIAFALTVLVLAAFVCMAGAEASVVRAAILGFIVLLASEMGRGYDMRNAIACAALLMVFANPKVLAFDIGFQLSFLALIGIVYLKPAITDALRMPHEPSVLSWKENLVTTLAAQLMVAPLLVAYFGYVSVTSLAANIAILGFIPLTMGLGFLIAGCSFLWMPAAGFIGLLVSLFLKLELFLIALFAKIALPFTMKMGVTLSLVYYAVLAAFWWRYHKKDHAGIIHSISETA